MEHGKYFRPSFSKINQSLTTRHSLYMILLILSFHFFLRFSVSLHGYSGENTPPRFGDYEAQRHWMELTTSLNTSDWYRQTEKNDLSWWGLDYPPLTAYHAWICGKISAWIEPESMELFTSRGYETVTHRHFMRSTAIVSEFLIYITGLYYFVSTRYHSNRMGLFFLMLLQPPLMIIDHGHFQYNSVSLGLILWAIALISNSQDLLGSVAFSLALNYKQMSLYFAPAFFFYLIGKNFQKHTKSTAIFNIAQIGIVVIATFLVCWAPFILEGKESVLTVLSRIFPVNRGLYEDKVANLWCSLAPIFKFKERFEIPFLVKLCAGTTLFAFLPACVQLLRHASPKSFIWTCFITSMSFFLFSFHVHEKSILFPILPLTLLIPEIPTLSIWIIIVATFSMFPLAVLDQTVIPYFVLQFLFIIFACYILKMKPKKFFLGIVSLMVIHFIHALAKPPPTLPHLFIIMFTTFSFLNFVGMLGYAYFAILKGKKKVKAL